MARKPRRPKRPPRRRSPEAAPPDRRALQLNFKHDTIVRIEER